MPTVGYASLQIVPSVEGIAALIQEQLAKPATGAGDEAAAGFSKRLAAGLAVGVAGAAVVAGGLLAKGLTGAVEQEKVAGKLGAQLGATGPEAQRYGQIAGQLYSKAVTEDIQGAADAVRATMSAGLLPPEATNRQIQQISTKVSDLAGTFELDLGQAANAVGQIMKTGLAPNATVALDTITRGLQVMGPRADDIADTFNEYSVIFQRLGLSAQQATGLMSQGLKAGARDTDVVADALKEFALEGVQGSQKIVDGFKAIGLNSDQMVKMISAGGPKATQALQMTLDRLRAMEDPVQRDAAAVNLFGTKSEDLQNALLALNPGTAVASLGEVAGAADRMGNSLRDNAGARLESFKRGLEQGLVNVVGGRVLPVLEEGATFLLTRFGPALTRVGGWIKGEVVPAAGDLAHKLGDELIPVARAVAGWLRDDVVPAAKDLGHWLRDDLVPAAVSVARVVRNDVGPPLMDMAGWLADNAVPAARLVAGVLVNDLVPALTATARWVKDNSTTIAIVAGVITAVLLPALLTAAVGYVQTGAAATVSRYQQVSAWVATQVAAVQSAAASVAASYRTVGGWIASGAAALRSAGQQVAGWASSAAAAVSSAASQVAAHVRTVAGWVSSGASAVASAAQQVGAWVATAARAAWGVALQVAAAASVVGGWILMGAQSLIQAARMAAAWVIAMGPVGWITAAVIALVALIIANWDTVVSATKAAWDWAWNKIKEFASFVWNLFLNWSLPGLIIKHWQSIKDGAVAGWNAVVDWVKQIPSTLYNLFLNFTLIGLLIKHWDTIRDGAVRGFTAVVDWARGVPRMIGDAVGSLGRLLWDAGTDLITGLWEGIKSMGGWLKGKIIDFVKINIPGPILDILGIHSPSRLMRDEVGRWIPAGIVAGINQGAPELEAAMSSLVAPPPIPAWMLGEAGASATVGAPPSAYRAAPAAVAGGGLVVPVTYNAPTPEDPEKAAMEIGRRVLAAVSI